MKLLSQTDTYPVTGRDPSPLPNRHSLARVQKDSEHDVNGHFTADSLVSTGTVVETTTPTPPPHAHPPAGSGNVPGTATGDTAEEEFDLDQVLMLAEQHNKILHGGYVSFKKGYQGKDKDIAAATTTTATATTTNTIQNRSRLSMTSERSLSESLSRTLTLEMLPSVATPVLPFGRISRDSSVTSLLKSVPLKNRIPTDHSTMTTKPTTMILSNQGNSNSHHNLQQLVNAGSNTDAETEENGTVVVREDRQTFDTLKEIPLLGMEGNMVSDEFLSIIPHDDEAEEEVLESEYEQEHDDKLTPLSMPFKSDEDGIKMFRPHDKHLLIDSSDDPSKRQDKTFTPSNQGGNESEDDFKYDDFQARMKQIQNA
ncbi:hypothetical protein RFI_10031, partial [Reticulomyxa filosa]